MSKPKSLARLAYEVRRSLEGKNHQLAKKRRKYGYTQPDYTGAEGRYQRDSEARKSRRYRRRKSREADREDLAEEIKGTRGTGFAEDIELRERAREELTGLTGGAPTGISSLAGRIAAKRATQKSR